MAMAFHFQITASSPTITKSHLVPFRPMQSSWKPNLSYIGLKHLGISICPKSANPEKKRRCSKGMVIRASLFGVGAPEALVIGVVALLVFGPKGLAEVARNIGKTLREFQPTIRELQDVSRDFKSTLEREIGLDEISNPNVYNQSRMKPPPTSPPPSVPSTDNPNDDQSPKAYTTEDYLRVTEEQLKASSPAEDQTQAQEPTDVQPPNGTSREKTSTAPPRQD